MAYKLILFFSLILPSLSQATVAQADHSFKIAIEVVPEQPDTALLTVYCRNTFQELVICEQLGPYKMSFLQGWANNSTVPPITDREGFFSNRQSGTRSVISGFIARNLLVTLGGFALLTNFIKMPNNWLNDELRCINPGAFLLASRDKEVYVEDFAFYLQLIKSSLQEYAEGKVFASDIGLCNTTDVAKE